MRGTQEGAGDLGEEGKCAADLELLCDEGWGRVSERQLLCALGQLPSSEGPAETLPHTLTQNNSAHSQDLAKASMETSGPGYSVCGVPERQCDRHVPSMASPLSNRICCWGRE